MLTTTVDLIIGATIAWLAWRSLTLAQPMRAVMHFIPFSLLVSIAWVRLGAADVAIAEAAIGAGLTGAMFLLTIRRLSEARRGKADAGEE